jgi:hypothetical protein
MAILQELGSPLHNLICDVRVRDSFCPQRDSKNADCIGTKRHRQSVNDDLATSLSPETFLQSLNLLRTKHASVCTKAQNSHGLEILLRALPSSRFANKGDKFRVSFGLAQQPRRKCFAKFRPADIAHSSSERSPCIS